MELEGAYTAQITPFDEDGNLDEEGYRKNIEHQIEGNIDGLVPVGTTGECATLSHEEHKKVVEIAIETADGRVPVIAGTGSNSTWEAVELTEHAADAGADAAMLVGPYYNKPTQEGFYEHYKTISQEIDIPQIVYNVPSRTGKNIEAETIIKLSKLENIIGVKEASGDLNQVNEIIAKTDEDFTLLSGDDRLALPIMSVGGKGVISVASNVAPGKVSELAHSFLEGNEETAKKIHHELLPLMKAEFLETNPGPIKAAMNLVGRPSGTPRLPLVEPRDETMKRLEEALSNLGLDVKK